MSQFWWVNHKQTFRQEIDGQYLWSPKTQTNGARSQFYDNMRLATPGDLVLSYANGLVSYVGRVAEFAFTAPKPEEFRNAGLYWNQDGWLLPVFWTELAAPVRPKSLIATLAPVLPTRHSPIRPSSGDGNQGVYLASIPQDVFAIITAATSFDLRALASGGANSLTFQVVVEQLDEIVERRIESDLSLDDTVKRSIILARRGQGRFRSNVEAVEKSCRLTGITNPSLLIASHIKPWRLCSSAEERLDGMNGLLLTPDADLLFDRGFISFEDDGKVLVSKRADRDDLIRLGFEQLVWEQFGAAEAPAIWRTEGFVEPRREYLDYHRSEVFVS